MTELGGDGRREEGKGKPKNSHCFFRKSFIKLPHRLEKREKFEKGLEGIISPHFGAQNQNKIKKESKIKIKNKSKKVTSTWNEIVSFCSFYHNSTAPAPAPLNNGPKKKLSQNAHPLSPPNFQRMRQKSFYNMTVRIWSKYSLKKEMNTLRIFTKNRKTHIFAYNRTEWSFRQVKKGFLCCVELFNVPNRKKKTIIFESVFFFLGVTRYMRRELQWVSDRHQ